MDTKKRRKRRFDDVDAAPAPASTVLDLSLKGTACKVHRNDHLARSLEQGNHLIDWNHLHDETSYHWGDNNCDVGEKESLWMERHDARTLLDGLSLSRMCKSRSTKSNKNGGLGSLQEVGLEEEIAQRNFQRFGLLPEYPPYFLGDKSQSLNVSSAEAVAGVGSQKIRTSGENDIQQQRSGDDEKIFELTEEERRELPDNITALPKTVKHNTVIQHTANRIALSTQSSQLEVFLKTKQANNSDFLFLYPSNELHRYYLFLKEKVLNDGKKKNDANKNNDNYCGGGETKPGDSSSEHEVKCGIAGLLGCYSSSDDEEDDKKSQSSKATNNSGEGNPSNTACKKTNGSETSSAEQIKRAERLERVRRWKQSQLQRDAN